MSFPRYERYKDSGVEWLGEVPEHWQVLPLKRGYQVKLGKMLQPEPRSPSDELLPYLRAANIQWCGANLADVKQMWFSSAEREELNLRLGDLLISEGGDVGRSTLWNDELPHCCFQNSVNRVRSKGADSNRFLYYWLRVMKDKEFIDALCNKSTIAHFTAEKVGAVPVPYPPCNEQESIASVLDAETAKIDALIEGQRRLIELLKEKRQAVISHAVTKGLNPNAPMKDSGTHWLGQIPENWNSVPLGYLIHFVSGGTPNKANGKYWDGDIPWVSPKDMKINVIKDSEDHVSELAVEETGLRLIEVDHILIVVRGMILLHSFPVARNTVPVTINQDMKAIRCSDDLLPAFLHFLFNGVANLLVSYAGESAHGTKKMATSVISSFEIPVPPIQEQRAVCVWLEKRLHEYDSLLMTSADAVSLLQERRIALISAAVTGKIDVRNYIPRETA